jgi:hypothetical protein
MKLVDFADLLCKYLLHLMSLQRECSAHTPLGDCQVQELSDS